MRCLVVLLVGLCTATAAVPPDEPPKDVVARLYQAHRSKHDPLSETKLLGRYFDSALLKLYLKDLHEANGEVGRLDGDPLYNAQETEITDFSIADAETAGAETRVTVRFNYGASPALVTGFGAVFRDVDHAGETTHTEIDYFDVGGHRIFTTLSPPHAAMEACRSLASNSTTRA